MKTLPFLAFPALVVLAIGALCLMPGGPAESGREVSSAKDAPRSSKSSRGAVPRNTVKGKKSGARDQDDGSGAGEGRTWRVAAADPVVVERLVEQRLEAGSATRERREGAAGTVAVPAPALDLRGEESGAVRPGAEFAAQVRAHRAGRRESMRQRYAELASHQPGCKCAHHMGGE